MAFRFSRVDATTFPPSDNERLSAAGPMPVPKLLLTIKEAATSLGVSRAHLYRLIEDGAIHTLHSRGAVRITYAELERYVARLIEERG